MALETWSVTQNGVRQTFRAEVDIVANFVQPCPYCGIPCTGTIRIWYVSGSRRIMFETDTGSFYSLLHPLISESLDPDVYALLPAFVRSYNEGTGWDSINVMDGDTVAADDLLATIALLERREVSEWERQMLHALRELIKPAAYEGREIRAAHL